MTNEIVSGFLSGFFFKFYFDFNGFHLKVLKITQYDFWTGSRRKI